ncbi:YadA-like family protein [Achromobacter sp. Root83]|uniref:YadA family autotransporter adhesin n=1 Tax=Achromobacter sp. Root83 TaxID=1736602 RepID=UPI0009E86166|nr:YadA-like family protein [Achromobacter sp. Root83]
MNHLDLLVWKVNPNTWTAVSEPARSRGKPGRARRATSAAAIALTAMASIGFASPTHAAGSGLQLCDPTTGTGATLGSAPGPSVSLGCNLPEMAFSLNNAGADSGGVGFIASTARITGFSSGTLELKGTNGISMLNAVNMNGNKITGVAAGDLLSTSTEAVNGSQLYATNQNVLSNTAALNTLDGLVAQNTANFNSLTATINAGAVGLVKQDVDTRALTVGQEQDGNLVDFTGTAGARQLTGVANGVVAADSLYAVNGGQLHAVSTSVANALAGGAVVNADGSISAPTYIVGGTTYHSLGGAVAGLDSRVTTIQSTVNNFQTQMNAATEGLVKQDPTTQTVAVAGNTGGKRVDMAGTDGARQVTGVANGEISADSTDAVNGSQLYAISQQMGEISTTGHYIKADGAGDGSDSAVVGLGSKGLAVGPSASVSASQGVAIGTNAAASAANSVAVGANSTADRADTVSVGSKGAERQVTHVAAGTQQTDAVNVGQLAPAVAALGGGAGVDTATGAVTGPSYHLDGQAYNNVGDALNSLDSNVQSNRQGLNRLDQRLDQTNQALDDLARNAYSGIAATTALTMVPEVDQGRNFALGMGVASYRGYEAVALGASARVNDRVKLKAGVGMGSGSATAGVGASMQW